VVKIGEGWLEQKLKAGLPNESNILQDIKIPANPKVRESRILTLNTN